MEAIWKTVSVDTIKDDVAAIETATEALKKDLIAASTDAAAADRLRDQSCSKDSQTNKGKTLQVSPADDMVVLTCLVATPFTKTNIRNARAKQSSFWHEDEKVRDAANNARTAITAAKRGFFADEKVYGSVIAVLNRYIETAPDSENAAFCNGLLKKFNHIGLFHIKDTATRVKVQSMMKRLSDLETKWRKNLQEYVGAFEVFFSDEELDGVPEHSLATMKPSEEKKGKRKVGLSYPHVRAVLTFCKVRSTRETIWKEFMARGGAANEELMVEMAQARLEVAKALGLPSYADVVQSQNRMAGSAKRVVDFLADMEKRTSAAAEKEFKKLLEFAKSIGVSDFNRWDQGYVFNLFKSKMLSLDSKVVGKYFPAAHVIPTVLGIYEKLLNLKFVRKETDDVWHKDVQVWDVYDTSSENADFLGLFYLDLWPRQGKYGHACVVNLIDTPYGSEKIIAADASAMLCNLSEQMSHGDVVTFFHEFGHVMHNVCGTIGGKSPYAKVPRDFVEAPSQMLENWCWQNDILKILTKHVDTGKPMPDDMITKLQGSRFWMGLLGMRRQVYYNKVDQLLHGSTPPKDTKELATLEQAFCKECLFVDSQCSYSSSGRNFGHTASQYSASYYGYLWSEVFSADMFATCFPSPESWTDPKVGMQYRTHILRPGGTKSANVMLKNFLGRDPELKAFLAQRDIL